jgi:hypothetical protein
MVNLNAISNIFYNAASAHLCSAAGLFKQKQIGFIALAVGMIGLIYVIEGFFLFL